MGVSGQLCAFRFNPREIPPLHFSTYEKGWPPEAVWTVEKDRSLLLCLGNEPRFISLPFLNLSPYIDWKYICAGKMYTHLCNKPKNANRRNIFHHILLRFTNMFRSLLRPSSRCHNRIKQYTNNCKKGLTKTTRGYN
jgi:hypothetical protein